jgi:hypothetical protein
VAEAEARHQADADRRRALIERATHLLAGVMVPRLETTTG